MNIAALLSGLQALWAAPVSLATRVDQASSSISQFEVHSLPGAPSLPPSWAGRLPVPDVEEGNSMFFWLFQAEDSAYDDNLIIWLNGGPGCSSLNGLMGGNGPISFVGNSTKLQKNPHSWSKLGHVLYVDQPVGTGYSTASDPYPVHDMDRVTSDFYSWLQSFLTQFPHLQSKKVYLIGESYAGFYVPYFASAIVDNQDSFPLNLVSLSMGDPTLGDPSAMSTVTIGAYLKSQQSALQIPDDIVSAFSEADEECGFDAVVQQSNTFPQKDGPIPIPGNPDTLESPAAAALGAEDCATHPTDAEGVLSSILNSTSCLGSCATFSTAVDYMTTVSASNSKCFDMYDITNDCDTIDEPSLLASYFSRADVQTALSIPPPSSSPSEKGTGAGTGAPFVPCSDSILAALTESGNIPTPPTFSILPSMVTTHNISLHIYSGENDMLLNHFGTELVLQKMTWNGARGFSQKPSRVFYSDNAKPNDGERNEDRSVAGVWGEERGVSYHLFHGAGHSVIAKKAREMFAFVRDIVVAEE